MLMLTDRRSSFSNRSRSRKIKGDLVVMVTGTRNCASTSRHLRVILDFPSTGWYGSVAVPIASNPISRASAVRLY